MVTPASPIRGYPLRALPGDRSGATAVVIGLTMTALMGFAGLAVDVGLWYADKRAAQGAADSAAYSAAIDYAGGDTVAGATATAKAVTTQYGLTDGAGGVTVTVNSPPASGPNTSTAGAVEVIIKKTEGLFFSRFVLDAASVAARAVAVSGSGGKYCVEALDTTTATSVNTAGMSLINGANLDLSQCGIQINTPGSDSLVVSGGAKLMAQTLSVVGNYQVNNGGRVVVSGATTIGAAAVADPYANVPTPTPGPCDYNNATYNSQSPPTINPGTYCNGLTLGNAANITMNPGVYIIDRGSFAVAGGAKLTATAGVTIVLTSSTGSNYATAEIDNGTNVSITAPTSGATSGLAIMQDRRAATGGTVTFAGGSQMNITGALYFPTQVADFSNGSTNNSTCTQLIAYRIDYLSGSRFGNNCTGVGVSGIGATATMLAE